MGGTFSKFGTTLITRPPECDARPTKRLCVAKDAFENYDVFISHRGPDTKTGFVGFLDKDLRRVGLHPFLDRKSIVEGQDSWKCIECAIQKTSLALVIFSESFAESEWCLKELHTMLACPSMTVLPIFYNVKPSDVYSPENGQLAVGFAKLKMRHHKTLIEDWKADLKQASTLNGWEYKLGGTRFETDLVQEVVERVFELANKSLPLHVGDHIVGVKQVAKNLIQTIDEKKVLMLGLWGMGGIGKSTLARELYNQLGRRYDASYYVEDVVEKVNQGGVTSVQNHILSGLCGMRNIVEKSQGMVILEKRLSKQRVLVVLDDVRNSDQMKYLMSHTMLLKEGSMCIVTSRDCRVFEKLTSFDVNDEIYTHDVQLLNQEDSQIVFACHVFGSGGEVPLEFGVLVRDVSKACGGVPLVLEVCGSSLRGEKDKEAWEEVLTKLNCGSIMNESDIFDCLRISYDALKQKEHQEMFLDIACGLLGESVEKAKVVWRSQGWFAISGVRSLVEKALIRVDEFGTLCMHDHLRDMGRAIAKQERLDLGICKRVWDSEGLAMLIKNEALLEFVETLILPRGHGFSVDLFVMKRLRILKCEYRPILMSSFPENLRWLHNNSIMDSPLRHILQSPKSNELVILNCQYGSMKTILESFGTLSNLQVLDLSNCNQLVGLPNSFGGLMKLTNLNLRRSGIHSLPKSFGTLSNLEVLNLWGCNQLVELSNSFGGLQKLTNLNLYGSGIQSLPQSFGSLSNLEVLNLSNCNQLVALPNSFGGLQKLTKLDIFGSRIQSLPESFGSLSNLEVLDLWGCNQLVNLPNSFGGLQKLTNLDLQGSGIQSFPESFGSLSNLEVLDLWGCNQLVNLPNSFGGLQKLTNLDLQGSRIQSLPESFGSLSNLEVLDLWGCNQLVNLPNSFGGLQKLTNLDLQGSRIQSLPESFGTLSNLEVLDLWGCNQLVNLPNSFGGLQKLTNLDLQGSRIQSLPESFGTLSNLEVLNLGDCNQLVALPNSFGGLQKLTNLNFRGSGIQSLPKSFGTLSNLEVLDLSFCNEFVPLPNLFAGLQNLTNLDLRGSGIQNLPQSSGTLSNLEVLNLEGCSQLVVLPNLFAGLQNLTNLDLYGSGIHNFLESFETLSNLEVLNLQGCNQLVVLPISFGGLQKLTKLNLRGSGIQSLPESFGTLSNLEVLNLLDCNQLVMLPNSFGGLQKLTNLDLYWSGIQNLPKSFRTLTNLEVLNLQSCIQFGLLPNSLGGLEELPKLDFHGSGIQSLLESFGTLSNLKVLHLLDGNMLVVVQNSFGGPQKLTNLDLEGRIIQGSPKSLKTLCHMESLKLLIAMSMVLHPRRKFIRRLSKID